MTNLYENLSWLLQPPTDFSKILLKATSGTELSELAKYSLDDNQLSRLSKRLHLLKENKANLSPLLPLSIGVIGNATTKLVTPALIGSALRFGISLDVIEAEYNQVAQEAFSADSVFTGLELNAIFVSIDHHGLPFLPSPGNKILANNNVQECFSFIKSVISSLRDRTGAQIILQNIVPPVESMFGSYEARLPGTLPWLISSLNSELNGLVTDDIFILDVADLASKVGLANWHDPTLWNMAKLSFSQKFIPIYADYVCRILAAKLGKSRRCLILDLDDTLWGGVIGDDGMEGILIGNGDPTAEAHLNVQKIALELHDRGIVLAICSKNEDAIARQPFREHPEMILKEDHIAVFQANWSDKASNIKAISEMLSLGLESFVFLDDSPAERMQVRQELPDVAVPELPKDPALYGSFLIAAGYFEAITFSEEDEKRTAFYQDNARRAQVLSKSSNMDAYLESLGMEITLMPFDVTGRSRIVQLISKSNQFNLTTKRYSNSEVKELEDKPNFFVRQIRLKDVFGDNGMISVIICEKNIDVWSIDTWLMSCRVLGRRVEEATLEDIVTHAKEAGASKLLGVYSPTDRNVLVKDHYKKLGFTKISGKDENETWELDITNYQSPSLPMSFKYAL
jgi:FkbH-like protein